MAVGLLLDVGKSFTSFENDLISIDLDVTQDETHEWKSEVTLYPVEEGSQISDNIRPLPDKITITGWITDAPINDEELNAETVGDTNSRTLTTFGLLHDLKDQRKLMTVYTKYKVYTSMALQSCNIPRSGNIGEAITFTMEFINIRLVDTQTVDVPPGISKKLDKKAGAAVQKKTQPKKDQGATQTDNANKSGAATLFDSAVKAPASVKEFLNKYGILQ